jgi:hypothetical protein
MIQIKKVQLINTDNTLRDLAEFVLSNDQMIATYRDPAYKRNLERDGIYVAGSGTVYPSDGPRFFDALDGAYATSSLMQVVRLT